MQEKTLSQGERSDNYWLGSSANCGLNITYERKEISCSLIFQVTLEEAIVEMRRGYIIDLAVMLLFKGGGLGGIFSALGRLSKESDSLGQCLYTLGSLQGSLLELVTCPILRNSFFFFNWERKRSNIFKKSLINVPLISFMN